MAKISVGYLILSKSYHNEGAAIEYMYLFAVNITTVNESLSVLNGLSLLKTHCRPDGSHKSV